MLSELPYGYKVLNEEAWSKFPGKLVGSSRPGNEYNLLEKDLIINNLRNGITPEEAGVNDQLISNLNALNEQNIQTIYSLLSPHDPLIKEVWETKYENKKYLTEIDGIETAIEDFEAPSQEQLQLITNDALERLRNGENILVHCEGGIGRTGTILAAIYMKSNKEYDADRAISYIRMHYSSWAIESTSQRDSLAVFGTSLQQLGNEKNLTEGFASSFTRRLENRTKASSSQLKI